MRKELKKIYRELKVEDLDMTTKSFIQEVESTQELIGEEGVAIGVAYNIPVELSLFKNTRIYAEDYEDSIIEFDGEVKDRDALEEHIRNFIENHPINKQITGLGSSTVHFDLKYSSKNYDVDTETAFIGIDGDYVILLEQE